MHALPRIAECGLSLHCVEGMFQDQPPLPISTHAQRAWSTEYLSMPLFSRGNKVLLFFMLQTLLHFDFTGWMFFFPSLQWE